jgi:hypothetical protein
MAAEERMQQFIELMYASGVARPGELRGCSSAEIAALERKYQVVLPRSYSLFLARMGHAAGKLGNLGEFDLSYGDALRLTEEEKESWRQCSLQPPHYSASAFPRHGLVFCARLGNPDYWLITCEGQEDSPVIHFDYENDPVRFERTQESLFGFLEELRKDAEHWVRQGTL